MAGFIQNTVNKAIRASASLAKGVKAHAGQIGKNPSAEAEDPQAGASASPMSSKMAAQVARENLMDKRNSNKMTKAAIEKWAGVFQEPPGSLTDKMKELSGKEPKHAGK